MAPRFASTHRARSMGHDTPESLRNLHLRALVEIRAAPIWEGSPDARGGVLRPRAPVPRGHPTILMTLRSLEHVCRLSGDTPRFSAVSGGADRAC